MPSVDDSIFQLFAVDVQMKLRRFIRELPGNTAKLNKSTLMMIPFMSVGHFIAMQNHAYGAYLILACNLFCGLPLGL